MLAEEFLGGLVLPLPIVVARLVGAALLCAVIGLEREASDRAAGLRTHMLVGMAAAAFALITLHLIEMYGDQPEVIRLDPIRLVEAATAGVAFLAAGMIVLSRGEVRNLTTGAGMWLAAAIGLAAGLGLWPIALLAAGIGFFIIGVLGRIMPGESHLKNQGFPFGLIWILPMGSQKEEPRVASLIEKLGEVPDPRRGNAQRHELAGHSDDRAGGVGLRRGELRGLCGVRRGP